MQAAFASTLEAGRGGAIAYHRTDFDRQTPFARAVGEGTEIAAAPGYQYDDGKTPHAMDRGNAGQGSQLRSRHGHRALATGMAGSHSADHGCGFTARPQTRECRVDTFASNADDHADAAIE